MSASLSKKGKHLHIRFRHEKRQYQRSLGDLNRKDAESVLCGAKSILHQLKTAQRQLPDGADLVDYVLSGGLITAPKAEHPRAKTLTLLADEYLAFLAGRKAETYISHQKTHLNHLKKFLGHDGQLELGKVTRKQLQAFLDERMKTRSPTTAKRERVTLRQFFAWAVKEGWLSRSPAVTLEPIREEGDSPPFRTKEEIEAIIERGGLTPREIKVLFRRMYLAPPQIAELLQLVKENAADEMSFVLHSLAAYTGMRRNELLKLRWEDIDFQQGYLVARSLKQSRKKKETLRRIELHPELRVILETWSKTGPGGQFVICRRDTLMPLTVYEANRLFWLPMRRTEWCLDSRKNWFKVSGFHMYRHSFVSNLASAGVDQRVIDEFVGHETEAMRRRYRHLFPNNRQQAISAFSLACPSHGESGPVLAERATAQNRDSPDASNVAT